MNEKDKLIALAEVKQAIESFLSDWYSVSDLFETAANAGSVLIGSDALSTLGSDKKYLVSLIDQHVMLANLMKNCEELLKEEEKA